MKEGALQKSAGEKRFLTVYLGSTDGKSKKGAKKLGPKIHGKERTKGNFGVF